MKYATIFIILIEMAFITPAYAYHVSKCRLDSLEPTIRPQAVSSLHGTIIEVRPIEMLQDDVVMREIILKEHVGFRMRLCPSARIDIPAPRKEQNKSPLHELRENLYVIITYDTLDVYEDNAFHDRVIIVKSLRVSLPQTAETGGVAIDMGTVLKGEVPKTLR